MYDFGNANEGQRRAIEATDGPVLITVGPGTGKTFTFVERAIYLIQEKGIRPEEILMATFTKKAAKELITRITNELAARGIVANLHRRRLTSATGFAGAESSILVCRKPRTMVIPA